MLKWFTLAGLVLDIIGVVLVWRFGLPRKEISRSGTVRLALQQTDTAEIAEARRYDRWAGFGLALLTLGFVLQVIGSLPK